jgi:hypothetical protein
MKKEDGEDEDEDEMDVITSGCIEDEIERLL